MSKKRYSKNRSICLNCSYENPEEFSFCGNCGAQLEEVKIDVDKKSKDYTERRQLTVMFCDLVDSTSLSELLDPEDFYQLINHYQKDSERIVQTLGGHIAQFLGDGILVYFGYPLAHEDDARRAVEAALDIRKLINNLKIPAIKLKKPLRIRISIHTGNVALGEIGGSTKREKLALGDVPNIAALIQQTARPNDILISSSTHQLIRGYYNCRKRTSTKSKGTPASIELYRVIGEKKAETRFETHISSGLTPLVGRDKELKALARQWREVNKQGRGNVLLINGEAGIGKSRLVYEFKQSIKKEPHTLFECQCWETARNSPLSPIINLLERILELEPDNSDSEKIKKIEKLLSNHNFKLKDLVPLFTNLLSLPLPKRYTMPLFAPEKLKRESLEAFIRLLEKISEKEPTVFIVEDIHWADLSTLELLSILIEKHQNSRMLSLLTHRPEFKSQWDKATRLKIEHLDQRKSEEIVERLIHRNAVESNVFKEITERSDGIPLYLEEITKALIEWGGATASIAVPITLNDYLMSRLDRLGEAKEVAQAGAVIGREFEYSLLKSVLYNGSKLLDSSVEKLMREEIMFETGRGRYIFKHALIQGAAYESIPKDKRREYHSKTAGVLEDKFSSVKENQPDLLAYHYEQAGEMNKAISLLSAAGALAIKKYAPREAIAHLQKGLELLKSLKASKDKDLFEITLSKHLQYALFEVHDMKLVNEVSERLISLCEKWKLYDEVINPLQVYIHAVFMTGSIQKSLYYTKKMNRHARRINNQEVEMSCLVVTASVYGYVGRFLTASKIYSRAISFYESHESTYGGSYVNDRIMALSNSSYCHWHMGYLDRSINRIQEALRISRKSKGPNDLPITYILASVIYRKRNQIGIAKKLAQENINLCEERGLNLYLYFSQILFVNSGLKLNQDKASIHENLKKVIESNFLATIVRTIFLEELVESLMLTNMYDKAIEFAKKGIETSKIAKTPFLVTAKIYKLKGDMLLLKSGRNKKKGEECYIKSLEIARNQKNRFVELEAVTSFSKLLLNQGRDREAKKILSRIIRWFDGRNKTEIRELNEARSLAKEIS